MKQKRIFAFVAALLVSAASTVILPMTALASFNQNNLMDDLQFNDSGSMNAGQIDAFLNSFPSSCISTNNGFSAPDVTGYNPSQGYLYGGNVSAGTIISHATQAYDLNPKVILTTLQKEQSMVTGGAGCHRDEPSPGWPYDAGASYNGNNASDVWGKTFPCNNTTCTLACPYSGGCGPIALGYDCPGLCYTRSEGFSKQIIKATWKLKFVQQRSIGNYNWNIQKPGWDNSDDPLTGYDGYMTQGNFKRNPSSGVAPFDGTRPVNGNSVTVHLDTGATASLYSYTPFLSGNQSFVTKYETWFGDTHSFAIIPELSGRYNELGNSSGVMGPSTDSGYCYGDRSTCWQGFKNGYIVYNNVTGTWESKGGIRGRWTAIGAQGGAMGYATGPENSYGSGWGQSYQNGLILGTPQSGFWEVKGEIKNRWAAVGSQNGLMGYPAGPETFLGNGWSEAFQNGLIVGNGQNGYWEVKGAIKARWQQLGSQGGAMGYPTGAETYNGRGWSQNYQTGTLIGSGTTGFWEVKGEIKNRWIQLGAQDGVMGYPTGSENFTGNGWTEPFERGMVVGNGQNGFWEVKGAIGDYWKRAGAQSGSIGYPTGHENYDAANSRWSQTYQNGTVYYSAAQGGWFVPR